MNDLHNFDNAEILAAERLAIEAAVIIAELNQEEYDVAVSNHSTIEISKSQQEKLVNTWAKRYVRTKRKRYTMQLFKRIGKCAAMAFALLCIFTTVLYVTVDAARVGITNFFVGKFDKYSDITFQPNEGGNILENDILVSWDKQHELVSFSQAADVQQYVYSYGDVFFTISIYTDISGLSIDTENCTEKKVEVNGESAVLYSKQDNSRTALYYLLNGKSIYIAGTLSEREIVDIAENLTA